MSDWYEPRGKRRALGRVLRRVEAFANPWSPRRHRILVEPPAELEWSAIYNVTPADPTGADSSLQAAVPEGGIPSVDQEYARPDLMVDQTDGAQEDDAEAFEHATAIVVDPLERTRAALEDARHQMPGMLGLKTAVDRPEIGEGQTDRSVGARHLAAEWTDLVTQLRDERSQLAGEVTGLRLLVLDLATEVRRLAGMLDLVQQGTVRAADDENVPFALGSNAAVDPAVTGSSELDFGGSDLGYGSTLRMPPDFGWKDRPEAIPGQPLDADGGPGPDATQPDDSTPGSDDVGVDANAGSDLSARREVQAGDAIKLMVVGVPGVRSVAAIEAGLAARFSPGHSELAGFRGGSATFKLKPEDDLSVDALVCIVEQCGLRVGERNVQDEGRVIRLLVAVSPRAGTE
ncbi:MAG TPA: hypothetical protein VIO16_05880 [Dehalococcoidia bacterium]